MISILTFSIFQYYIQYLIAIYHFYFRKMIKVTFGCSKSKFFFILINTIVYSLKLIGLAPFSVFINKKSSKRNFKTSQVIRFSKIGQLYNILLSILVPIIAAFLYPYLISLKYDLELSVTRVTDSSQGTLCVLTSWLIIITWTYNHRKSIFILNKIIEIGVKLSSVNKQPLNEITSNNMYLITIHLLISIILWIVVFAIEYKHPMISNIFVDWFFFNIPSFIIYWFISEYFIILAVVANKYFIINKNLSNFKKFQNYISPPSFLNDYLNGWNLSTHNQLAALNSLHNIRTELFDLSQNISDFFSFPILSCVGYSFISLVYNVYILIIPAVVENNYLLSMFDTSATVTWILISIYPLAALFYYVTKILNEARLTGQLIHKLLSGALKEEIKTELELFSLQLLQENINFTAYGFFTLDFTLLHSMLGAMATYLVILIQFQS